MTTKALDITDRTRRRQQTARHLYHTTTPLRAEIILREQRLWDSEKSFHGRRGVWLSSEPIDYQDEKVHGDTLVIVDVELPEEELDRYDFGRNTEGIEGYRTFFIPSAVLDGRVVITRGGDIDSLPIILDGMSEEEKEIYYREQETEADLNDPPLFD